MATYPVAELIRQAPALFGVPSWLMAGALYGVSGSLDQDAAAGLLEAWLGEPPRSPPAHLPPPHAPLSALSLIGHGAPSVQVGIEGNYYLDADTGVLYGPKTGDVWPTGPGLFEANAGHIVMGGDASGPASAAEIVALGGGERTVTALLDDVDGKAEAGAGDLDRADSTAAAPRVGSVAQWVSQPVHARPLRVAVFGLSIANTVASWPDNWPTDNPRAINQQQIIKRGFSPINCANMFLGQRLRVVHTATIPGGQSGPMSDHASLLYRIQNPADVMYAGRIAEPDIWIMTDTPGDDLDFPTALANTIAVYDFLRAIYPNALGIGTTLQGVSIAGNASLRALVNEALRDYFDAHRIRLWDMEQIFTDRTTGLPPVGETLDVLPSTIHSNYKGALRCGKTLAALLWDQVPQGDVLVNDYLNDSRVQAAVGGLGAASLFIGSGGTDFRALATGKSGIAAGWTVDTGVVGGGYELVADDKYGQRQVVYIPTGQGAPVLTAVTRTITPASPYPAGALIGVEGEITFHGDLENVQDIYVAIKGTSGLQYTFDGSVFGTTGGPASEPGAGVTLTFKATPMKLTAPETDMQISAAVNAQAGSYEVRRLALVRYA